MKNLLVITVLLLSNVVFSQENSPKATVEAFFTAFHQKDSVALKAFCHKDISLQTVANTKNGTQLKSDKFKDFLKSIASIPNNMKIYEKLLEYKVTIDGDLAHVWTPYEFYVNDTLSHIGANSFTMIKENDKWLIVHLIDTRRKP
ncbi:MAG: nuclear transport factor 2 family protein [Flavobacterium sp.]|jgi:hypothetical protein|nr:nuclear transport factor 2 family protein [Flavobacterium sp.]